MSENLLEITGRELTLYGEVNESLTTCNTGLNSGHRSSLTVVSIKAPGIHVKFLGFGLSIEWAVSNCQNAWGHLSSTKICPTMGNIEGRTRNSGSPDRGNSGGDGAPVVVRANQYNRRRFQWNSIRLYSTGSRTKGSSNTIGVAPMPAGIAKLQQLLQDNTNDPTLVNTNLMQILSDIDILIAAYSRIKSKPGNMTPGTDSETLDGVSRPYLERLQRELNSGVFSFKPARRLEIPKPKGGTRPLGIASPRDKIVQSAMTLILEAIFEPSFSAHSHGFRPGKGCHSALGEIRRTFTAVSWFVEADISKCFDSFDHKRLVNAVGTRVNDQAFMDLLWKSLRAGYIFQHQYFDTSIGTPQGSVLSPLLCNIYLDQLDRWLNNYKINFYKGARRRTNPE